MQKASRSLTVRLTTLKGFTAFAAFIVSAILVEYLIVVYAMSIGVIDETGFQIPWTGLTVSPLFHLVPVSTVIVLAASWACMTKYVATKPVEKTKPAQKKPKVPSSGFKAKVYRFLGKIKARLLKVKGVAIIWGKLSPAKANVKSALTVLFTFLALVLLISVLANPWLVYKSFVNLYHGAPQLLESVRAINNALGGFAEAVAPVGWLCASINNALRSAASGFRGFASILSVMVKPLVDLPPVGRYLVFQNLAAWGSALVVLFYGAYTRKSYHYRKGKKI